MSSAHQQMTAVRERLKRARSSGIGRRSGSARPEIAPSAGAFRPEASLEVAGERSERRIGEQVDAAFEPFVGEPLRDRGDQSAAPRAA